MRLATIDLTPEQIEAFAAELDALEARTRAQIGEQDAEHIRRVLKLTFVLYLGGRGLLLASLFPPAWIAGTCLLTVGKILDNMEIGHNVMHGQYDFMNDPHINTFYVWDALTPRDHWRHSHNYVHHTFTNVLGMDHDIGYRLTRVSEEQPWHPLALLNLHHSFWLATLFDIGAALHDLNAADAVFDRDRSKLDAQKLPVMLENMRRVMLREYVLLPLAAGPMALPVLAGNALSSILRNYWVWAVVFCGHFPDGTAVFTQDQLENETRGQWYLRQMLGSANIDGGRVMQILTGHLSHQIEHHLFPTIPAWRYPQMAEEVRAIAAKYGVPYTTGPFGRQIFNVIKRLVRLSLPISLDDARYWRRNTELMRRAKATGAKLLQGLRKHSLTAWKHPITEGGEHARRDPSAHVPSAEVARRLGELAAATLEVNTTEARSPGSGGRWNDAHGAPSAA